MKIRHWTTRFNDWSSLSRNTFVHYLLLNSNNHCSCHIFNLILQREIFSVWSIFKLVQKLLFDIKRTWVSCVKQMKKGKISTYLPAFLLQCKKVWWTWDMIMVSIDFFPLFHFNPSISNLTHRPWSVSVTSEDMWSKIVVNTEQSIRKIKRRIKA